MEKKSYFFVFIEESSKEEKTMEKMFTLFEEHHEDTEVKILRPRDEGFNELRTKLEVRKLPGFAIADEPEPQPFISFGRGNYLMEKLKDEGREFYELISDLHYSLIDEDMVRVGRKMAYLRLAYMFGRLWEEVKDLVTISP